jgi:O-acetyl-ADP-ribose deacetylase (regulator of RNase III)
LQSNAYALVNTVNTVGVMGKGIALQFKKEFPYNYAVYRNACLKHELQTGHLLTVKDTSLLLGERLVINLPTKTHWRLPSEYSYIAEGLIALAKLVTAYEIANIALPALGCGNGGLDWPTVKQMICRHLEGLDAVMEVYEPAQ